MPITEFRNILHLNDFYRSITSHNHLTKIDDATFILMKYKHFDIIRASLSIQDVDERYTFMQNGFLSAENATPSVASNELENQILLSEQTYHASEYASSVHRIYPYSKNKFLETFFSDFVPSFRSRLLEYLTDKMGIVRQIGSGSGSAIIVKDYEATSGTLFEDINSYCSISYQSKDLLSSVSALENLILNQNKDIEYLNNYINTLEQALLNVSRELDEERKQGINGFYRTWH